MRDPSENPDAEKNSYETQFQDNWRNFNINQISHDIRKLLILVGMKLLLWIALYVGDEY